MTCTRKKSRCPKTTRETLSCKLANTKFYGIRARILFKVNVDTKVFIIMKESSKDMKKYSKKRRTSGQKLLDDLDKKK